MTENRRAQEITGILLYNSKLLLFFLLTALREIHLPHQLLSSAKRGANLLQEMYECMYVYMYVWQPLQLATICVICTNPLESTIIHLGSTGTKQEIEQDMIGLKPLHLLSLMAVLVAAISPKMQYCFWLISWPSNEKGEFLSLTHSSRVSHPG